MTIITGSDFRLNQAKWLGLARSGEKVVVRTRNNGDFRIMPVAEESAIVEKRGKPRTSLEKQLREAFHELQLYKEGKKQLQSAEELLNEL